MTEEEIVGVFEKAGMTIDLGSTYSVKGQLAQLLNGVNSLAPDEPHARREYKLAYIENGKRHHCGEAETIQEAESLRSNRAKIFAPLEVVILEKETVCREIRYT
ncbi:hypothetical protein N9J84_01530 [Porticoccaceae bacterium]|nr:hypothetical protein [Porticoccaceae bacterium]